MQRNRQTHQINPMAFSGRCYLGLAFRLSGCGGWI
jgi:hypothetical protein